MRPWLVPARPVRATEATPEQLVSTGAMLGSYGRDPVDGDVGFRLAGTAGRREVPYWTRERARDAAVAAYRSNPMAVAIVDTYTSFCVGDSGVKPQVSNPQVAEVVNEFWNDPANRLGSIQELALRSQMLLGEQLYELMQGPVSGVVRFAPIEPAMIADITKRNNNALWLNKVLLRPTDMTSDYRTMTAVWVDDSTGLRAGDCLFWAPWKTLITDVRGLSFMTSILDDLDSYSQVLSNLIDRTALARYIAFQVKLTGGTQDDVNAYVENRRGTHLPPSGSIEVTNDSVEWSPINAQSGAFEDTATNQHILTSVAAGAGLSKHWLAEPDGTNRATSHTMAEPVRRRVAGVQKQWLEQMTELVRFAVDRAVAARRLPEQVEALDPRTNASSMVPAAQSVMLTGPEIAAADAQLTAQVLLNLSTGLMQMVEAGILTAEAASVAAQKGWEDYVGVPYQADLGAPGADANPDDIATHVDDTGQSSPRLAAVPAI